MSTPRLSGIQIHNINGVTFRYDDDVCFVLDQHT
jgi:hypothetical protein